MKIKAFLSLSLFSLLITSFISCNNSVLTKDSAIEDSAVILISFDNFSARTINPNIDYSNISDIKLTAQKENSEPVVLGTWNSKEAAINKPIQLEIGEYTFVITAQVNGAELSDSIEKTVVSGNNTLEFNLQLTSYADEGTGSLDVKVYFPSALSNLCKVEALFKNYEETQIEDPVSLTVFDGDGENSDKKYVNFSKVNCRSGNYLLQLNFYRGSSEENYICYTYLDVVIIADNLTSKKEKFIPQEDFNELHTITYNLNGGSWTNDFAPKEYYTLDDKDFALPNGHNIEKSGYAFSGWHLDKDLGDTPVCIQKADIQQNVTYYASYVIKGNGEGYGDIDFKFTLKSNTDVKVVDYTLNLYKQYTYTNSFYPSDSTQYNYCTSGTMKIKYENNNTIATLVTENESLPAGVFYLTVTIYNDYKKQNKAGTFGFLVGIQNNQLKQYEYAVKLDKTYSNITYRVYSGYVTNDVFAPLFYEEGITTPLMSYEYIVNTKNYNTWYFGYDTPSGRQFIRSTEIPAEATGEITADSSKS